MGGREGVLRWRRALLLVNPQLPALTQLPGAPRPEHLHVDLRLQKQASQRVRNDKSAKSGVGQSNVKDL